MQTFLPYSDFAKSASCLDRQRLGKQRVEVLQILRTLLHGGGWRNHPAVRMWRGHERTLVLYGLHICKEWIDRGYNDTCAGKIMELGKTLSSPLVRIEPPWLGDRAFHLSHKSNLMRKMPSHYGQFQWVVSVDLPYIWPV